MKGTFECQVVDHVITRSKKKRTPSIKFKLLAIKNAITGVEASETLYYDSWLTEDAIEGTLKFLTKTFHWVGDDLDEINKEKIFVGQLAWAEVIEKIYEGKPQNVVNFLNPVGDLGPGVEEIDPSDWTALNQKLRGKILKFRQENSVPVSPLATAVHAGVASDGDGLPFP